jgi:RNA polymerase sigma-70 factor (ECF subfamily)
MVDGSAVEGKQVLEDYKVIVDVLAGNKEAFSFLVNKYLLRIKSLVYLVTNDSSLVDDLTQDIFIKAYESLDKFENRSSFYTWLYSIAVNKCRDEIRKKKFRNFISLDKVYNYEAAYMPDESNNIENKILLKEALQKLKHDFREILILKEVNDFSYQEISVILNCEIGTVRSKLSRARTELAKILKKMSGV